MLDFHEIISQYINDVTNQNDKKILQQAINLIESEPIILDEELDILTEFFSALKKDYTIKVITDEKTLDFCIAMVKQDEPIVQNKYQLKILVEQLKKFKSNQNVSKIENAALKFLEASEHIEENETMLIQNIINYLNNNWTLKPIETNDEQIKYSRLIPVYSKHLRK